VSARGKSGSTPLHQAALGGQAKVVDWLLSLGAEVSVVDDEGWSPLHVAVRCGLYSVVSLLLHRGASTDLNYSFNRTPLHIAVYGGDGRLVDLLITWQADQYLKDGYGRSSLEWMRLNPRLSARATPLRCTMSHSEMEDRTDCLHRSIHWLSKKLADSEELGENPGFHELGHCLMYLGNFDDALTAYEQQITAASEIPDAVTHAATCNACNSGREIEGARFVLYNVSRC
jgi:hypothetical protein